MRKNIVFLDRATLPADYVFRFSFPHTLAEHPQTVPEDTAARLAGAHIAATNKVRITAEHLAANPQLEMIAVCATGSDHIDTTAARAARAAGVAVCNVPAYGSEAVAEHAFMLMIALMRNLPAYRRDLRAGLWQNSPFFCHFGAPIRDLHGKTLAVFGRGGIGGTLAGYARAFGMHVVFAEHKNAAVVREGYVSFDTALQQADVLSTADAAASLTKPPSSPPSNTAPSAARGWTCSNKSRPKAAARCSKPTCPTSSSPRTSPGPATARGRKCATPSPPTSKPSPQANRKTLCCNNQPNDNRGRLKAQLRRSQKCFQTASAVR